ncbi:ribosome assembly factor SBDS [Candidatus Woesearchaeota archaeon]|nr:ribosome assembly factor SBDS [Candidatus Woesearchaeota archaeon]
MGVGRPISMDQERVSFNLALLKKGGKMFQIVVDPDKAIEFKKGHEMDIKDVLRGEHIFTDAKKGVLAPEADMKALFNSSDPLKVASVILKTGEIQLTTEYRDKLREEKKKRVLYLIHRNAADPKTKLPHPMARIENAFDQAKCKIDEFKTAEEQVDDVIKKLRTILPIRIEQVLLQIDIPPQHAPQAFGVLKRMGEIKQEVWGNDGGLTVKLQIPAGLQEEVMSKMNNMTHGGVDIRMIGETR